MWRGERWGAAPHAAEGKGLLAAPRASGCCCTTHAWCSPPPCPTLLWVPGRQDEGLALGHQLAAHLGGGRCVAGPAGWCKRSETTLHACARGQRGCDDAPKLLGPTHLQPYAARPTSDQGKGLQKGWDGHERGHAGQARMSKHARAGGMRAPAASGGLAGPPCAPTSPSTVHTRWSRVWCSSWARPPTGMGDTIA